MGGEFDDAVAEFVEMIASKPPLAIQAIKRSAAIATQTGLEEGIAYDRQQFEPLLATEDHDEGAQRSPKTIMNRRSMVDNEIERPIAE